MNLVKGKFKRFDLDFCLANVLQNSVSLAFNVAFTQKKGDGCSNHKGSLYFIPAMIHKSMIGAKNVDEGKYLSISMCDNA